MGGAGMSTGPGSMSDGNPPDAASEIQRVLSAYTNEITERRDALVDEFHQQLLSVVPSLVGMTGGGRPICQRTIMAALDSAQRHQSLTAAALAVQRVGRDNSLDGFQDTFTGAIARAMLQAVRTVFAREWSSSLSSTWVQHLMWFQANLQLGARAQAQEVAGGGDPSTGPQQSGTAARSDRPEFTPAPTPDAVSGAPVRRAENLQTTEIDRIVVRDGQGQKTLTVTEWIAVPLLEQIGYLSANPEFYAGDHQVDTKEAIAALRRMRPRGPRP